MPSVPPPLGQSFLGVLSLRAVEREQGNLGGGRPSGVWPQLDPQTSELLVSGLWPETVRALRVGNMEGQRPRILQNENFPGALAGHLPP